MNGVINKMAAADSKKASHKPRTTREQFILQAEIKFGDKFTYELVVFEKMNIPVTITCTFHGPFTQAPDEFMRGKCQCPWCREKLIDNQKVPQKWVVVDVWQNRYSYTNFSYIGVPSLSHAERVLLAADPIWQAARKARKSLGGTTQQISIHCQVHNVDFKQACADHIHGIVKCPNCVSEWTADGKLKDHNGLLKNSFPHLFERLLVPDSHEKTKYYDKTSTVWKCSENPEHLINAYPFMAVMKGLKCTKCLENKPLSSFSKIYSEWNEELNEGFDKSIILAGDGLRVHWICKKNKHTQHKYQRTIAERCIEGLGCSVCHTCVIEDYNRLSLYAPHLLKEWHIENVGTPNDYSYGSKAIMKWTCDKNHTWSATIRLRAVCKTRCPICSGRGYSKPAIAWLTAIENECNIMIDHAENGGEQGICGTSKKADGYCSSTNTVYEYHGDYWHGNPEKYKPDDAHPLSGELYGSLYEKTMDREALILSKGYTLVRIWESEYNRYIRDKKVDPTVKVLAYCQTMVPNSPAAAAAAPVSEEEELPIMNFAAPYVPVPKLKKAAAKARAPRKKSD